MSDLSNDPFEAVRQVITTAYHRGVEHGRREGEIIGQRKQRREVEAVVWPTALLIWWCTSTLDTLHLYLEAAGLL